MSHFANSSHGGVEPQWNPSFALRPHYFNALHTEFLIQIFWHSKQHICLDIAYTATVVLAHLKNETL